MSNVKSKHLVEGALVTIITPKSHLPDGNRRILEVHEFGLVITNDKVKDAPIQFVAWAQIIDLKFIEEGKVEKISTVGGVPDPVRGKNK